MTAVDLRPPREELLAGPHLTGATGHLARIRPHSRRAGWSALPRPVRACVPLLVLVAAWWVASGTGALPPRVLPGPPAMVATARDLVADGTLFSSLLVSGSRVATGLAGGILAGVLLAVIAGTLAPARIVVDSTMQILRMLPWAAFMPLLVIWFGIGEVSKTGLVFWAVLFPIYLNLFAGLRDTPGWYVETGRILGYSRLAVVTDIVLPRAMPYFFTGLRYSLANAWIALVFAEQINADAGIGFLIAHARTIFRVDIIIVCLVVYGLFGVLGDAIVRILERTTLQWQNTMGGTHA